MSRGRQKGGRGTAVVALIIGMIGLAMGGYSFFVMQTSNRVTGVWYAHYDVAYSFGSTDSQIPKMNLNITINAGDTVWVIFTASLDIEATGVVIRIHHDGTYNLTQGFGYYYEHYSDINEISVTVQHYLTNLAAGPHNISIWIGKDTVGSAFIEYCSLMVQSFKP